MKSMLILMYRFPYPLTEGSSIRMYNIAKLLKKEYKIHLLILQDGEIEQKHINHLEKIFNKVTIFKQPRYLHVLSTIKGLFKKEPLQVYYYYFKNVRKWIIGNIKNYDICMCFHIRTAKYLEGVLNKTLVIDLIDATSINYFEAKGKRKCLWSLIYNIENKRLLNYELEVISKFDLCLITSQYDKAYLEKKAGRSLSNIIVIPNGVKEKLFHSNKILCERDWIIFIGKMNTNPNIDAVVYFAREIFPHLKKRIKNIKFLIVGGSPTTEVISLGTINGVIVTGFVDDPYDYVLKSKVVVAPLRFSAGIQNKVLEPMALGKAVVSSANGVRGIAGGIDGEHFCVAKNSGDMEEIILALLNDKEKREIIGERAKALIKEKYRWDTIGDTMLSAILHSLDNKFSRKGVTYQPESVSPFDPLG